MPLRGLQTPRWRTNSGSSLVPLALGVMAIVSRLGPVRQSYQIDGGGFAWFCGGPRLLSGAGVYFVGNSATS